MVMKYLSRECQNGPAMGLGIPSGPLRKGMRKGVLALNGHFKRLGSFNMEKEIVLTCPLHFWQTCCLFLLFHLIMYVLRAMSEVSAVCATDV